MPSQDATFEAKKKFIKDATAKLDRTFSSLSEELLKLIIEQIADRLEKDGDQIKNTPANLKLIALVENLYNDFSQTNLPFVAAEIITGANKISGYNVDYFQEFDTAERDFKATTADIQQIIQDRLGVTRGQPGSKVQLKPGGYLQSLLEDNTIKNQIKDLAYREIIKQTGFKALKTGFENLITGSPEKLGGFRQYYKSFAYDIFTQVDAAESKMYAVKLDLQYFRYEGTIIKDSREFCRKRAGKVFSLQEAEQWKNDPWIKNAIEKGYIASYDPVVDRGLFFCRHILRFISEETAFQSRPDLKE